MTTEPNYNDELKRYDDLRKHCDSTEKVLLALRWFTINAQPGYPIGQTFLRQPDIFVNRTHEGKGVDQAELYIYKAYNEFLLSILRRAKELAENDFEENTKREKQLTGQPLEEQPKISPDLVQNDPFRNGVFGKLGLTLPTHYTEVNDTMCMMYLSDVAGYSIDKNDVEQDCSVLAKFAIKGMREVFEYGKEVGRKEKGSSVDDRSGDQSA